MTTIAGNLQRVQARLASACAAAGRAADSVRLLAVSKTFDAGAVQDAFTAGQRAFGENYVQEAVEKITRLADLGLEWHMIGPLQSNKTRLVAEHFDWVHTVDRLKIAERLSAQRPEARAPLSVCLQVNMDAGQTKSGLEPEEILPLARAVAAMPRLSLRGLMSIPEPSADAAAMQALHARTRALFEHVGAELAREAAAAGRAPPAWDTLSMGMSADLEPAVAAGSTLVRVGTAIFGGRVYPVTGA